MGSGINRIIAIERIVVSVYTRHLHRIFPTTPIFFALLHAVLLALFRHHRPRHELRLHSCAMNTELVEHSLDFIEHVLIVSWILASLTSDVNCSDAHIVT